MPDLNSFITDTFKLLISSTVVAGTLGFIAKAFFEKQIQEWLLRAKADLDKELETHKAHLLEQMEAYKWRIKRQELFFEREIEAADQMQIMCDLIMPTFNHPDMDYHDACTHVYQDFGNISEQIRGYLTKYKVFVKPEIGRDLENIASSAESRKFHSAQYPDDLDGDDLNLAKKIMDELPNLKDQVILALREKIYQ